MNCKDFKEIADSYLSNELLVETNHDVLRHLETCGNCRNELGARRELRECLRSAVINAPQSQINPGFATRLKSDLREQAFGKEHSWTFAGSRVVFAGFAAVLLIFGAIVVVVQNQNNGQTSAGPQPTPIPAITVFPEQLPFQRASFVEARNDAVEDHKHCALTYDLPEAPISLKEAGRRYDKANIGLDLAVMKPLREAFGDQAKFVEAHFCLINGRRFAHVVIQYHNKTVSVLLTKMEEGYVEADGDAISCRNAEDLRVACFESGNYSVFVVSDLTESDNLLVARSISTSVKKHIEQNLG